MIELKTGYRRLISRSKSWFLLGLLALVPALIAWGCAEQIPGETEQLPVKYVLDDLGRLVAINGTPQSIISLAPSNTEILFALGLGDKVVGVTDWCDYPPEASEKPKVGAYDRPDIEKIVALSPDLVLVAHGTTMDIINRLVALGLTVFGIKTTDLDDLMDDIRRVGEITDRELEAQALTSDMAIRIETVSSQTRALAHRPKVFYMVWHDPLWTAGSGTFIHELIEKAGGVNVCANVTGYATVSIEEIVARDPEIIISSEWSYDWAKNATELAGTNARRTGRIYTCDDDLVQRPGPRLVDGLEWFAHFIHPEIFKSSRN